MELGAGTFPLAFSLVAGILPTVVYVLLIWRIDRYEKEPLRLLLVAFLWGAVPAILLSIVLEVAFDQPLALLAEFYNRLQDYGGVISMGIITPPVEEMVKGLALLGLFWLAHDEFDGALDGIIYGSLIGFGFAMTENVLYFSKSWQQDGLQGWSIVVFIRSLVFGLNHAMYTSFTGIGFGLARYSRSRWMRAFYVAGGLLLAIIAHALHNIFLSVEDMCLVSVLADWIGVGVILVIVLLTWRREWTWMSTQLADEVRWGVLTEEQLQVILSRSLRWKKEWEVLGTSGVRQARFWHHLADTAIELAFKTHQRRVMGQEKGVDETISRLRARIIQLRLALGDTSVPMGAVCGRCGRPSAAQDEAACPYCHPGQIKGEG